MAIFHSAPPPHPQLTIMPGAAYKAMKLRIHISMQKVLCFTEKVASL